MSGYVRGTCHTSKASFLLQLYLLNLISGVGGGGGEGKREVRSKAVINFHQVSRYRSCIRGRGRGEGARGEGGGSGLPFDDDDDDGSRVQ